MSALTSQKPEKQVFTLALLLLWMILGPFTRAQHPLPETSPLDLLPLGQATHTVENSGNWSDPNTWAGGVIPGNLARVLIPAGKTLTVDGEISTRIKIIRNQGKLRFSPMTGGISCLCIP